MEGKMKFDGADGAPDAFCDYGEYGERLWMEERDTERLVIGRTDYGHDQYRRLRSETRSFPVGCTPESIRGRNWTKGESV